MSYRNPDFIIENFQPFVVPPLEGLWPSKTEPIAGKLDRNDSIWRLMSRITDFVDYDKVEKAKSFVESKKGVDVSKVIFVSIQH